MATTMASRGRGRGRSIVLTSVFAAALIAVLATVSPAMAAEKGSGGPKAEKSSASVSAPVAQSDKRKDTTVVTSDNGAPNNGAAHGNKKPHPKKTTATAVEEINKQDRGPNKPVGDKYDGPCTRHDNIERKGPGHNWHQGEGKGHSATDTDQPPPCDDEEPPDDEDNPPDDNDVPPDDGPGDTPEPPGTVPDDEPFSPFTITRVVYATPTSTKSPEKFLPYTGGESRLLLAVAACTALAGTKLRFFGRTRSYHHRRIAR